MGKRIINTCLEDCISGDGAAVCARIAASCLNDSSSVSMLPSIAFRTQGALPREFVADLFVVSRPMMSIADGVSGMSKAVDDHSDILLGVRLASGPAAPVSLYNVSENGAAAAITA